MPIRKPLTLAALAAAGALMMTTTPFTGSAAAQTSPGVGSGYGSATVTAGKASLSPPHAQNCQQGFEAFFGVPAGIDPDETVLVRGAAQTIHYSLSGSRPGDTLEMAMPYERMLPGGGTATGKILCHYQSAGGEMTFLTHPYEVIVMEGGKTQTLTEQEIATYFK